MIWNMFFQNMKKFRNKAAGRGSVLALCCFILASFCGCARQEGGQDSLRKEPEERLSVVTTIFPQYDFVRQIAGDKVELKMLLKPGEETHSYEPTPQDIIAIQKSDLFIYVGGENDAWVEDILESPEMKNVRTFRLVDQVETLEEESVEGMKPERGEHEHSEEEHEAEAEYEDGHEAGGEHEAEYDEEAHEDEDPGTGHSHTADEHVWTSPLNAVCIVEGLTGELCVLDEKNESVYQENAEAYIDELYALDAAFREVTAQAKGEGHDTLLFGDRFPFRYFTEEYGLSYYAAFPGCASDTEPSAATMAFLINKMRDEKYPLVLKMELSNGAVAEAVAEACGTDVKVFYSCHNLTAEQFECGETYLSMMWRNVETLKEALGIWH